MKPPVKPRRTYRSAHRAEQAEDTRRRILAAARKVFVAEGFAAATMVAVAAEAGTSVETVYAAFGNKAELLASTVRAALTTTEGKGPLHRTGAGAVRDAADPREQLRLFAGDITALLAVVSPIFDVVASARREPKIGELYQRMQKGRLENLRTMVGWLRDKGGLRPGLDLDAAAETVWALASPELFRMVTQSAGWSKERFAGWLAEILAASLLPVRDAGKKKAKGR